VEQGKSPLPLGSPSVELCQYLPGMVQRHQCPGLWLEVRPLCLEHSEMQAPGGKSGYLVLTGNGLRGTPMPLTAGRGQACYVTPFCMTGLSNIFWCLVSPLSPRSGRNGADRTLRR
jgi:hypothetical protein